MQNEEKCEYSKDRILLKTGVGVTCLVQSNIFRDYLQFTNVGDVVENGQLSELRQNPFGECEVLRLNPFVSLVGHSDLVVSSPVKVMEQINV